MTEQRLVDLAVLSFERDLSELISLDEIIDTFAREEKKQKNCFILSYCTEREMLSVVMCVCVFFYKRLRVCIVCGWRVVGGWVGGGGGGMWCSVKQE